MYTDLSTWDLRDMSFNPRGEEANPGYYFAYNGLDEIYFNPCRQIDFNIRYPYYNDPDHLINWYTGIQEMKDHVRFGTFAVWKDGENDTYKPLTKNDQWEADDFLAIYPVNEHGDEYKHHPIGIS
jgi:hypothetical protein